MSENLRKKVIKLAFQNPGLRRDLLPLVSQKRASGDRTTEEIFKTQLIKTGRPYGFVLSRPGRPEWNSQGWLTFMMERFGHQKQLSNWIMEASYHPDGELLLRFWPEGWRTPGHAFSVVGKNVQLGSFDLGGLIGKGLTGAMRSPIFGPGGRGWDPVAYDNPREVW